MTDRAMRKWRWILGVLLLPTACSQQQVERANSAEVLCAAEALYMARQPGLSPAQSDRLRTMVARFKKMVQPIQREEASARIDTLADRRGRAPLAIASECDRLLAKAKPPRRS